MSIYIAAESRGICQSDRSTLKRYLTALRLREIYQ